VEANFGLSLILCLSFLAAAFVAFNRARSLEASDSASRADIGIRTSIGCFALPANRAARFFGTRGGLG
jgi:hypothetical protein